MTNTAIDTLAAELDNAPVGTTRWFGWTGYRKLPNHYWTEIASGARRFTAGEVAQVHA